MVRKKISDESGVVIPGTAFLKKVGAREAIDTGFWLVHDLEDKCWYVIDKPTGLWVTRAETSSKAKANFDLLRDRAFKARSGKGYEDAKNRLLLLQGFPIWDPKKESGEGFAKRLGEIQSGGR